MGVTKMVSRLKRWMTILYTRCGFGRVEDISEYSVTGISEEVYWFDSDSRKAGHCTPFKTVLMNRRPFQQLSERAQDYVFLHEVGHASLSVPLTVVMYALLVPTLILALFSPIAAANQTVLAWLTTNSWKLTLIATLAGVFVIGIFTGLFTIASWLSEGYAELFALRRLGSDEYIEVSNEIRNNADRGRIRRVLHRIQYPPPRLVVWISKKI